MLAASARAADRLTIAEERMDGLRVFRVGLPEMRQLDSFYLPRIEALARSIMGLVRPDAVHCHNLPGLGVALVPIAKAAGARVVVTLHDTWGFCLRQTRLGTATYLSPTSPNAIYACRKFLPVLATPYRSGYGATMCDGVWSKPMILSFRLIAASLLCSCRPERTRRAYLVQRART